MSPIEKLRKEMDQKEHLRNYSMLRKARRSPERFLQCDDCDRAFSKYKVGGKKVHDPPHRMLKTECPFCGSEEISNFNGGQ